MRKSKTHFEQIPVEEAKKNAEEEVSKQKQSGTEGVIVDVPAKTIDPRQGSREIA
jgi:hypothetical protein